MESARALFCLYLFTYMYVVLCISCLHYIICFFVFLFVLTYMCVVLFISFLLTCYIISFYFPRRARGERTCVVLFISFYMHVRCIVYILFTLYHLFVLTYMCVVLFISFLHTCYIISLFLIYMLQTCALYCLYLVYIHVTLYHFIFLRRARGARTCVVLLFVVVFVFLSRTPIVGVNKKISI